MKAEWGIASLLVNSDWSNKIMNTFYVHDINESGMRSYKLVCEFRLEQQDHEHSLRS